MYRKDVLPDVLAENNRSSLNVEAEDARSCSKKVRAVERWGDRDVVNFTTCRTFHLERDYFSHSFKCTHYIMLDTSVITATAVVLAFALPAGYWTKLVGDTVTSPYLVRSAQLW